MRTIAQILDDLKKDWETPRLLEEDSSDPYAAELVCAIYPPSHATLAASALSGVTVPPDVKALWDVCGGGELFKDVKFGQWGLRLASPSDAVSWTKDYRREDPRSAGGDLVIGKFIGDNELLIALSSVDSHEFGRIVVVDEINKRVNWLIAAQNLRNFLDQYATRLGRKYWHDESIYMGGAFHG